MFICMLKALRIISQFLVRVILKSMILVVSQITSASRLLDGTREHETDSEPDSAEDSDGGFEAK